MRWIAPLLFLGLLAVPLAPAAADPVRESFGGDLFVAGSGTAAGIAAERDLFVAGGTVTARGTVVGDAHYAGFDVDVETAIEGNLYAAGGSVSLRAPVGEDLTAAGFTLRTTPDGRVAGNARLSGGSVVVEGPVAGALLVTAGEATIDAEIGGDLRISAGEVSFGPGARIGGRLAYSAPEEVAIPASVIDPDRVSYTASERLVPVAEAARDWRGRDWRGRDFPAWPGAATVFGMLIVIIGFFVVLAAAALAIWPARIEAMRQTALARPGLALLGGVVGLATLFGLVPIAVMTILGLPLVPVVLLAILVVWILGYAFGTYVVALRIWTGMGGQEPSMPARLGVFAGGLLVVALLNVIPFLGWVINFTLVLFGIGALAVPVISGTFGQRGRADAPQDSAAPEARPEERSEGGNDGRGAP